MLKKDISQVCKQFITESRMWILEEEKIVLVKLDYEKILSSIFKEIIFKDFAKAPRYDYCFVVRIIVSVIFFCELG